MSMAQGDKVAQALLAAAVAAEDEHLEADHDVQSAQQQPGVHNNTRDACEDLLRKYGNDSFPESGRVVVAVRTIKDTLAQQGIPASPVSQFAASIAVLQQSPDSTEVKEAFAKVLASVLALTPPAAIRTNFAHSLQILQGLVLGLGPDNTSLHAAVKSLGLVLRTMTAEEWVLGSAVFQDFLQLCIDSRPKVRKEATAAVRHVLISLSDTLAAAKAHEMVVLYAGGVLAAPARAAQASVGKQGAALAAAEGEVTRTASAALHMLFAIKRWAPELGGNAAAAMCAPLVDVLAHGQPVLAQYATEALAELARTNSLLPAGTLSHTLGRVLKVPYDKKDAGLVLALQGLVQQGLVKLHSVDPELSARHLAAAFHTVAQHLGAQQEGVVFGSAECLKTLLRACVDTQMVQLAVRQAALAQQEGDDGPSNRAPSALQSIAVAVESILGYRFRHVWGTTLPIASTLVERLGPAASVVLPGILSALGEMAALRERSSWPSLQGTLGVMLRVMGPERVLAVLPLNLQAAVTSEAGEEDEDDEHWFEARGSNLWLLPVMRQHLCGARLAFFAQHFLPLAKQMATTSAKASQEGRSLEAQRAATAEFQLWSTLPNFCNWASDTATAFPELAKELGAYLTHRPDLRAILCSALQRLIHQNSIVLDGTYDPASAPVFYNSELAKASINGVARFSRNFLPIFFNLFVAAESEARGVLHECISSFAAVTDTATIGAFFRTMMRKLMSVSADQTKGDDVLLEGGNTQVERRCTFLHLLLALEPGVEVPAIEILYKAVKPCVTEKHGAIQKKAYRILAHLCSSRTHVVVAHLGELHQVLLAGLACCTSSAKRNRLQCIGAVIPLLHEQDAAQFSESIAAFLGEVVLGVKEVNVKTRVTAYDLLVKIARNFEGQEINDMSDEEGDKSHLQSFFAMVMSGLAGSSTTMVGATIFALARLLFEFSAALIAAVPELLPAVLLLIKTHNRETVKAVLGFIRVVAIRLPVDQLTPLLDQILTAMLVWGSDDKNRHRMKVRILVERLLRRCGEGAVASALPEGHDKLLTHIRKMKDRNRKKRGIQSEAGDDKEKGSMYSTASARQSQWQHTMVFGSDGGVMDDEDDIASKAAGSSQAGFGGISRAGVSTRITDKSSRNVRNKSKSPMLTEDTMDLLDESAMKRAMASAGRANGKWREEDEDFAVDDKGRMVITEVRRQGRKRERDDHFDYRQDGAQDDDADESRSMKSVRSRGNQSVGMSSRGGKSRATSIGGKTSTSTRVQAKRKKTERHSKEAFKPKKKGTGGDMKTGEAKVEPYAYWKFDAKMLNRRQFKKDQAKKGLDSLVKPSKKLASQAGRKQRTAQNKK